MIIRIIEEERRIKYRGGERHITLSSTQFDKNVFQFAALRSVGRSRSERDI